MGLKKAFGKECVATKSSMMTPVDVPNLKSKIHNDVLENVVAVL